jgi:predicted peptidase
MACGAPSSAASAVHATALTEVFGDGLKLTAVAVRYDRDIDSAALDTASFAVADRMVTRVYANTVAAAADSGRTGPYVIIELSPVSLWTAAQDVFASSYVVAGQWPVEKSAPLARKRLWYTVSQGDAKAYPGADAITALAERNGARVARAVWNAQSDAAQFDGEVASLLARGADINYVAFALGSTLDGTPSGAAAEHMGTWRYAYDIPGILDWVLRQ